MGRPGSWTEDLEPDGEQWWSEARVAPTDLEIVVLYPREEVAQQLSLAASDELTLGDAPTPKVSQCSLMQISYTSF